MTSRWKARRSAPAAVALPMTTSPWEASPASEWRTSSSELAFLLSPRSSWRQARVMGDPAVTMACSSTLQASRRLPQLARAMVLRASGSASTPSPVQTVRRRAWTSAGPMRRKSKRWHRERMVAGILWASVVQRMK